MFFVLIIILGLVLDQLSKWLVVQNLPLGASQDVLGSLLRLHHVQNTGAAWSMFRDSTFALAVFSVLCNRAGAPGAAAGFERDYVWGAGQYA